MALLALILALVLERYFHTGDRQSRIKVSNGAWFFNYSHFIENKLHSQQWFSGTLKELVLIFLPVLLLLVISETTQEGSLGTLFLLIVSVATLVHCLGPESPRKSLREYFADVREQDQQGAYERAAAFTGLAADNWQQTQRQVSEAIFSQTQIRYFSIVIWFAIAGPAGALLYRLLYWYLAEHSSPRFVHHIHYFMEWFSGRICALIYLLAGDMAAGVKVIKKPFFDYAISGLDLVAKVGVASIGPTPECADNTPEEIAENYCSLRLSERAGVVLFALVAIYSLLGWSYY